MNGFKPVGAASRNETGVPHLDSKQKIENHIRSLGMTYSIIRPAAFMSNWEFFLRMIFSQVGFLSLFLVKLRLRPPRPTTCESRRGT